MESAFVLGKRDFWYFHRYYYLHRPGGRKTLAFYLALVPVVTFLFSWSDGTSFRQAAVVTVITWLVWIPLLNPILRLQSARVFRKWPDHFKSAVVSITEDCIIWKGPYVEDRIAWPAIQTMAYDKGAVYLFVDANRALVLPRGAFKDEVAARLFFDEASAFRSRTATKSA